MNCLCDGTFTCSVCQDKAAKLSALNERMATLIAGQVAKLHPKAGQAWDPVCGQWIVYGFERVFGFAGAVSLESVVERAYRLQLPIHAAALEVLSEITAVQS